MIRVYGKHNCNWCVKARELLNAYNMQYEYIIVGEGIGITELLEVYPGTKTVPLIEVDGKKLGGYEELTRYVEETKNDYGHSI